MKPKQVRVGDRANLTPERKAVIAGQVIFNLQPNPSASVANNITARTNTEKIVVSEDSSHERFQHLASPFFTPLIAVWEPHVQFPGLSLTCNKCHRMSEVSESSCHSDKTGFRTKGWTNAPRRVYGYDSIVYVFTRVYLCKHCDLKLFSHSSQFLSTLPYHVYFTNLGANRVPFSIHQKDWNLCTSTERNCPGIGNRNRDRWIPTHYFREVSIEAHPGPGGLLFCTRDNPKPTIGKYYPSYARVAVKQARIGGYLYQPRFWRFWGPDKICWSNSKRYNVINQKTS